MTSPEKLATPDPVIELIEKIAVEWDGCEYDAPGESLDIGDAIRRKGFPLAHALRLATQRQGEGENRKIAQLIIDNDRAGAVKWATGLIGNFDGPSCRIDPDATSQGVAVARPDAREAALEQAANLVECEYAADATQGRRLAQIAQHIRDLKKRGV